MKFLFIFIICLPLIACKPKKSEGGSDGSSINDGPLIVPLPTVSIDETLEEITSTNAQNFTVSGSCSEEGQPITVSVEDLSPETAPTCTSDGAWTLTIDVTGLNQTSEISILADHSTSNGQSALQATGSAINNFTCPENYVGVPALADYTTNSFCVMKYEAKSDGTSDNNATSKASDRPYVDINRDDSIDKCTALGEGYDLITNDEWQSIARNIELVEVNWKNSTVGDAGGLSRGHTDNSPERALAASSDDTEGCSGTEQSCSNTTWDSQRRTHTLSNREVIWDLSGNIVEWVKDTSRVNYGAAAQISQVPETSQLTSGSLSGGTTLTSRWLKDQFGPSGDYSALNSIPYGGLGYGQFNYNEFSPNLDSIVRGSTYAGFTYAGVFAVITIIDSESKNTSRGFRCVYHP